MTTSRLRLFLAASLLTFAACAGGAAEKIRTLDAQALKDYEANRPQDARKKLVEALAIAKDSGLDSAPEASRARLYLGIVYVGALKQKDKGIEQMTLALQATPDLKLPKSTAGKARVKKAYATAKMKALMRQTGDEVVSDDAGKDEGAAPPVVAAPVPPPPATVEPKSEPKVAEAPKPPPKVVQAPKPPPPPEPADDEPDPPATLPTAVYCPLPDEVPPATNVAVWCMVRNDVNARGVRLYFRPPGQEQFSLASMSKTKKGWFAGEIPGGVVNGKMVQYYVEAVGNGDKVLAATGDFSSPNLLLLRSGAKPVRKDTLLVALAQKDDPAERSSSEDENPLAMRESAADVDDGPATGGTGWFFALGFGTGYGWHGKASLEYRFDLKTSSGSAGTGLGHVLPEVGYVLGDHAAVSLQARLQLISAEGNTDGRSGKPASGAFAALVRYTYAFGDPSSTVRPFVSAALGGGAGVRLVLPPNKVEGQSGTDTVRGGPVILGPGAGVRFRLGENFALITELRTLMGVPDSAFVFDANAGLGYAF